MRLNLLRFAYARALELNQPDRIITVTRSFIRGTEAELTASRRLLVCPKAEGGSRRFPARRGAAPRPPCRAAVGADSQTKTSAQR
ncbi:Hypothetical protein NTJ_04250 [Nesidiocoris tenuis]|uniref:Uncharacterized protein n=1 Tax=Nesidiocoris tenuis TaxID=355587 RepID=A0ABN7AKN3_9HEMI|nr:Hypothetical protein NTJ_04250 [Nesidiocoris tenuis]